ncbi:MAG TPA: SPFH domain-containing protein [Pseudonocardiaceae bacterium]|jgi:regulator of protease activity HflC (stomatin/prohibitin superfamily)|nr:SPFH domain-containing protein [Pseudonocardiaceae bacterium]
MTQHTPDTPVTTPVVDMPEPRIRERTVNGRPGLAMLALSFVLVVVALAALGGGIALAVNGSGAVGVVLIVLGPLILISAVVSFNGLTSILPGEARVVQLFGRYVGTARVAGLHWFNPVTRRRRVSTRIRNRETAVTKVNDADGNPIEIAAVVVWQVEDTARAVYEVDDFVAFVDIQTETAVRHIATSYPYDSASDERLSLRDNAEEITATLSAEIAERVESAGVRVIESRLTRLAYAPEIAQTMLRRQQASAVVAARTQIVEGAVSMVELALHRLDEENVVELDEERKATMVSNLLVVLCSDHATQPVVNTGSLYH